MQTITEAQFRKMGELARIGATPERIAKRVGVHRNTVADFITGQTRNPVGMAVFEEMTRPPSIEKAEHEAWLASSGYRGFAEASSAAPRGSASRWQPQG